MARFPKPESPTPSRFSELVCYLVPIAFISYQLLRLIRPKPQLTSTLRRPLPIWYGHDGFRGHSMSLKRNRRQRHDDLTDEGYSPRLIEAAGFHSESKALSATNRGLRVCRYVAFFELYLATARGPSQAHRPPLDLTSSGEHRNRFTPRIL
ncbi:hypothetical protein HYDPIDRAFT_117148, partial [Hydnomerulius pinastri MD-312]